MPICSNVLSRGRHAGAEYFLASKNTERTIEFQKVKKLITVDSSVLISVGNLANRIQVALLHGGTQRLQGLSHIHPRIQTHAHR